MKQETLLKFIANHPKIAKHKQDGALITAFLSEPIEVETFMKNLFDKKIILTHFVKRKESLEEQFLQLTDQK